MFFSDADVRTHPINVKSTQRPECRGGIIIVNNSRTKKVEKVKGKWGQGVLCVIRSFLEADSLREVPAQQPAWSQPGFFLANPEIFSSSSTPPSPLPIGTSLSQQNRHRRLASLGNPSNRQLFWPVEAGPPLKEGTFSKLLVVAPHSQPATISKAGGPATTMWSGPLQTAPCG